MVTKFAKTVCVIQFVTCLLKKKKKHLLNGNIDLQEVKCT